VLLYAAPYLLGHRATLSPAVRPPEAGNIQYNASEEEFNRMVKTLKSRLEAVRKIVSET
jgi:hypothetical protein